MPRRTFEDQMMTSQQTADYLGCHVKTLRRRWREWELPGYHVGRALRFKLSEVERWLSEHGERAA